MGNYKRATNHQKCIRVGGKHNDLETVGKDLYHHTFFEMLGSWSFGDYFKVEACAMALELLTKVYGLPVNRLYFTYFSGDTRLGLHPDLETKNIWQSLGIPQKRILPFYMEDNFWDMGKTGPCGPCTEIHYDHTGDGTGVHLVYRVVADHIRMSSISIADSLLPNRSGLGLTLRIVMSQCFQQAHQVLRMPQGSVSGLVDVVVDSLGEAYPELQKNHSKIKNITKDTEKWFTSLVSSSETAFSSFVKKTASKRDHTHMSVEDMMDLHKGKYGTKVPLTIMQEMAVRQGYSLEDAAFKEARIQEQPLEQTAEQTDKLKLNRSMIESLQQRGIPCTDDSFKYSYTSCGGTYEFLENFKGSILGLMDSTGFVDEIGADVQCGIIVDRSMFYSEAGGQAADIGYIKTEHGSFRVEDVQTFDGYVLHIGHVESGELCIGETALQTIDKEHRMGCMRNHTATHLLLEGLRKVIDVNAEQAGSRIYADHFSFDFTTPVKMEADQVSQIEDFVQESIYRKEPVARKMYPRDIAMEMENIIPLRDEVYPSEVFVLSIGNAESAGDKLGSTELCGGTHVTNTGDIGEFYITSAVRSKQATKRIYAVTGQHTQQVYETGRRAQDLLQKIKSGVSGKGVQDLLQKIKSGVDAKDKIVDLNEWVQELKNMLDLVMPKVVRDQVLSELPLLTLSLARMESEILLAIAQQVITKEIEAQQNESFVLCRSDVRKEKQGIKLLLRLQKDIDKPLCLVSDLQSSILVAVAGPKNCSMEMEDAINQLIKTYGCGTLFAQSKGDTQLYSTDLKKRQMTIEAHADKVCEVTRTVLDAVYAAVQQEIN